MAVMAKNIQKYMGTNAWRVLQVRFVKLLWRSSCRLRNFSVVCAYNVT